MKDPPETVEYQSTIVSKSPLCRETPVPRSNLDWNQKMLRIDQIKGNIWHFLKIYWENILIYLSMIFIYLSSYIYISINDIFLEMSYITLYLVNFWFQSQVTGTKFRRVRRLSDEIFQYLLTKKRCSYEASGTKDFCKYCELKMLNFYDYVG